MSSRNSVPRGATNSTSESSHGLGLVVWGSMLALGLFAGWAYQAEIDQITRGQGQIIASSRTQIIQTPDGGVLEELLVREGAEVQQGELLARLERTKVEASYREAESKVGALSATVSRLRAEVFGGAPAFNDESQNFPEFRKNQIALLRKRRSAVNQEIASIARMRDLAMQELKMMEPLLGAGDVSMGEILRLQRQVADQEGQISNRENKYLQDVQAELNKAEEELSSARELLIQRNDQLTNTELKAPVNGTVKNVRVTTRGGVLRPGDELMQIVPVEDNLIVEAKVKPSDVAFLKPGLDVTVKIDAYDYTIYGSLPGKLTFLSADTMSEDLKQGEQAYYRVQVKTASNRFNRRSEDNLSLQPGMTASIEVKTGQNTVLMYLLKPIIKTLNESFGER
ncbi:HlyD family type I secretion periplasmic adaptor subunit [Hydrogenophaga taeniospiralis]|uniref:HlyD family type I secretion periplasmic adaptor subunit n=1 Tax=Hydrogenophaga taeniospiralis TaxID=65656 RepID=UPI001CF93B14|nr:HlyD family type I secretion periplasmic adaptor subunit [Hydrogenophaga taeniospiralis]UCU92183.1 HlyD family type I secretion periplasmic adaptor subunit [Hydrogenophaga taeniospiralis]